MASSRLDLMNSKVVYCRDDEINILHECFNDAMYNTVFCSVGGVSGSGKSNLVNSQVSYWKKTGSFFASGKFEIHRSVAPLSSIVDAMYELVLPWYRVATTSERKEFELWMANDKLLLKRVFPRIFRLLSLDKTAEMVGVDRSQRTTMTSATTTPPTSSSTTGPPPPPPPRSHRQRRRTSEKLIEMPSSKQAEAYNENMTDRVCASVRRLISFFCCRDIHQRVVVFLDDIQWADQLSIVAMKKLLKIPKKSCDNDLRGLLFVATYRSEEVNDDHPIGRLLSEVRECFFRAEMASDRRDTEAESRDETASASVSTSTQGPPVKYSHINLEHFGLPSVARWLAAITMRRIEDVERLAAVVYEKTGGNAFFVTRFMQLLQDEGFISYSFTAFRWEWGDEEQIHSLTNVSSNVADILVSTMRRLPNATQQTLMVSSCLGTLVPLNILRSFFMPETDELSSSQGSDVVSEFSSGEMRMPVSFRAGTSHPVSGTSTSTSTSRLRDTSQQQQQQQQPKKGHRDEIDKWVFKFDPKRIASVLRPAVKVGILTAQKESSTYKWSHDKLQQAAYSMIPDDVRGFIHLRLGHLLWDASVSNRESEFMVFMAADQMNKGSEFISEDRGHINLAKLNLAAAKLAISRSAFFPAADMLRSGVRYLGTPIPWDTEYDLCLELFNGLARMEVLTANHNAATVAAETILANARKLEDKYFANYTLMRILRKDARDYQVVVNFVWNVLKSYGVKIPKNPNRVYAKRQAMRIRRALPLDQLDKLLSLPDCNEEWMNQAMSFLSYLENWALLSGQKRICIACYSFAILHCISIGRRCAALPAFLVSLATQEKTDGNYNEACAYGRIANQLASQYPKQPGSHLPQVWSRAHASIFPCLRPIHETLDPLLETYKISMLLGDTEFTFVSSIGYALAYLCIGLPIRPLISDLQSFSIESRQFGLPPTMFLLYDISRQTLLNLTGRSESKSKLFEGEALDANELTDSLQGKSRAMTLRDLSTFRLMLGCIFCDLEVVEECTRILSTYPFDDVLICRHYLRLTYLGLGALLLWRERRSRKHRAIGKRVMKRLRKSVKKRSVHSHPLLLMLQAEAKPSQQSYQEAIKACGRSGLLQHQAYMTERAGLYYFSIGDEEWGMDYLHRAETLYGDWGAAAKVESMKQQYRFLTLSSTAGVGSATGLATSHRSTTSSTHPKWGRSRLPPSQYLIRKRPEKKLRKQLLQFNPFADLRVFGSSQRDADNNNNNSNSNYNYNASGSEFHTSGLDEAAAAATGTAEESSPQGQSGSISATEIYDASSLFGP